MTSYSSPKNTPRRFPDGGGTLNTETGIEIIGQGNIGEKARQLRDKTVILRNLGFHTPTRIIIAEQFLNEFLNQNNLGKTLDAAAAGRVSPKQIQEGSITDTHRVTLKKICDLFSSSPLAVRSSAEGDARGTGTYRSEFCDSEVNQLNDSLKRVVASYFSEAAIAFRRDANTGEGFGVIVEPIIGQTLNRNLFGPVLSGFGYTSTSRGGAYINVVVGLGGGVDNREGEIITKEAITAYNGALYAYIEGECAISIEALCGMPKRGSVLVPRDQRNLEPPTNYYGKAIIPKANRSGDSPAEYATISFEGDLGQDFKKINLTSFFEMIENLEKQIGNPQYFEWVMTIEDNEPKYWITQIADINKRADVLDFNVEGETIFFGFSVTGTGNKNCTKIVYCKNPGDIALLRDFNKKNTNYVLFFSSRLTTRALEGVDKLNYNDFNNAAVLVEIPDAPHLEDSLAHLTGQLEMTGKFFAVLDSGQPNNWSLFGRLSKQEGGLTVYPGQVSVLASASQNRLVINRPSESSN